MDKYNTGEHVQFWSYSYDSSGDLEDATAVTIQIVNSEGTEIVAATAMTKSTTGTYYYNYTIPATGPFGVWRREMTDTTGSLVRVSREFFLVEGEEALQTIRRQAARLTGDLLHHGTADSATGTTLVDAELKEYVDADITGKIEIISGTGAGQVRTISSFAGSSGTVTVATWTTNPDSTSVYEIYKAFGTKEFNDGIRKAVMAIRHDYLPPAMQRVTPVSATYTYNIADELYSIHKVMWDKGSSGFEELPNRWWQLFYDSYIGEPQFRMLNTELSGYTSYTLELHGQRRPIPPVVDEDGIDVPVNFVLYYTAMYVEMQRTGASKTRTEGTTDTTTRGDTETTTHADTDTETRERSDSGGTTALARTGTIAVVGSGTIALAKTGTTSDIDLTVLSAKAGRFAQLAAEERLKHRSGLYPGALVVPRG